MNIEFSELTQESQILALNLDDFAANFGHQVDRQFPIWVAHINGKLVAYGYVHPHMVVYPAVSPRISPREFYYLAWTWFAKMKQAYGDPLIAVSQLDKEHVFSKVGLEPFDRELYRIRD